MMDWGKWGREYTLTLLIASITKLCGRESLSLSLSLSVMTMVKRRSGSNIAENKAAFPLFTKIETDILRFDVSDIILKSNAKAWR